MKKQPEKQSKKNRYPELTEEDLEKMIAEQSKPKNLPKWWGVNKGDVGYRMNKRLEKK